MGSAVRATKDPIDKLDRRHEALMVALLVNPNKGLGEVAEMLGYSMAWVSRLYNSDMFQARFREMQAAEHDRIKQTLHSKLMRNADEALDAQHRRFESGEVSDKFILESTSTLLRSLGYGVPTKNEEGPQRHVHLHVDADALHEARQRIGLVSAPAKVGSGGAAEGGPTSNGPAEFDEGEGEPGDEI